MKKAILFCSSLQYWPQCRLAISSAMLWNPECEIFIASPDEALPCQEYGKFIHVPGDGFQYWGKVAAAKALLLEGYTVMYLDADTYCYAPLTEAWRHLELGVSILLFPHHLSPPPPDKWLSLANTSLMGEFNDGVWGASPKALPFFDWWDDVSQAHHELSAPRGIVGAQGWLRFAPCFDPWAYVCREPGYNLAYWNLEERGVQNVHRSRSPDNPNDWVWQTRNARPLVVAHFSGMESGLPPGVLSRYRKGEVVELQSFEWELYYEYQRLLTSV